MLGLGLAPSRAHSTELTAGTELSPQQVRVSLPLLPSRQPAPGPPGSPAVPGEREEGAERALRGCPVPPTRAQLQPRSHLPTVPPAAASCPGPSQGATGSLRARSPRHHPPKAPEKTPSPGVMLVFPRDCCQGYGRGQGPSHHQVTSFTASAPSRQPINALISFFTTPRPPAPAQLFCPVEATRRFRCRRAAQPSCSCPPQCRICSAWVTPAAP